MPIDVASFRERLMEQVEKGMVEVGDELAAKAKEYAPVRKSGRARASLSDINVKYGPSATPTTEQLLADSRIGLASNVATRKRQQLIVPVFISNAAVTRHNRRVFRGTAAKERGGHLRDSIHSLAPDVEGNSITVRVVADAPYAYYVEHGFHHRGGKEIQGRSFMRKALNEDIRQAGAAGIAEKIGKVR